MAVKDTPVAGHAGLIPFSIRNRNGWKSEVVLADGTVTRLPPSSRPADYMIFRAEMDLIVVFSACPQDITPINGLMRKPTDAHYAVF